MLIAGFMGEAGLADATICFVIGLAGWGYILYEVFSGEAGQINAASANESCQSAYNGMKLIVSVGWAIYPLGYFLGYLNGAVSADSLNLVYNLADLVNKIGFGMFIWAAAVADSAEA
jgi:bacteriorhodopsin